MAARASVDALVAGQQRQGSAAALGGGGKKWSEVCERVQQPDGSVRISPPFKSSGAATVASAGSPPKPRPQTAGHSLGVRRLAGGVGTGINPGNSSSSRGGSSKGCSSRGGSSGKSSRSSSRDVARDGDVSSRCSSGCWETSTNSSLAAPSPSDSKLDLLMPDPIRTGFVLPPALLDDSDALEGKGVQSVSTSAESPPADSENRPGISLKWDPYGRDAPRRCEVKPSWSVDPLTKYLKGVVGQINTNVQDKRVPTSEKLDAFVSRLVSNTQRQLKHAPRKVRHTLQALFSSRFLKFWNYVRNEKVRTTSPEELRGALGELVDALTGFASIPDSLAQPSPVRGVQRIRVLDICAS